MSRLPIPHIINTIKTKLGFDRTMTAPGDDVVDAVNKQALQIDALENGLATVVNGDTATNAIPPGGYAYIKNNTHGLAEGIYINSSNSTFPVTGGVADQNTFSLFGVGVANSLLARTLIPEYNPFLFVGDNVTVQVNNIYKVGNVVMGQVLYDSDRQLGQYTLVMHTTKAFKSAIIFNYDNNFSFLDSGLYNDVNTGNIYVFKSVPQASGLFLRFVGILAD